MKCPSRNLNVAEPFIRDRHVTIVKQYDDELFKMVYCSSLRKPGFVSADDKLREVKCRDPAKGKSENNLSRAKTRIFEMSYCNEWDYFFTGTVDPKKGFRDDLNEFKKKLRIFIMNYNRNHPDHPVKYILIPEKHEKGGWHVHGLLKGIDPRDLYINDNGYLSWHQYDKSFGFMSIDKIKDKFAVSAYITKYINKGIGNDVEFGKSAYLCSQGLKRPQEIIREHLDIRDVNFDFAHENFTKVKMLKDLDILTDLPIWEI